MKAKQFVDVFPNRIGRIGVLWGGRFSALAVVLALGLLFGASAARAGCGMPAKPGAAPFVSPHDSDLFDDQANHEDSGPSSEPFTVVGLWNVNYTGTYDNNFPPGQPATTPFPFLESYKTWHADGTEFENAFLPPTGGNVCFGVWKDLGRGTVKLHHIGLMFAPDGSVSNVFTVDETDTVAPNGKTYKGTFDFKVFDSTDVYGTGTPVAEVKGTMVATRISVD
ncbi:MAG TPA: hypothetical protein VHX49_09860 [Candidatus Acidoferrales bacterium]|nr:hypothetical protein [Candidatus Acidoferrales bacterium]